MRLLSMIAGTLLVTASALPAAAQLTELTLQNPSPAPAGVTLPDVDGERVSVQGRGDAIVLVHFWATWCVPCVNELPALQSLWESRRGQGLEVIAVAADSRREVVRFAERFDLRLPVVIDAYGEAMRAYRVRGLPVTVVLDRTGAIRSRAIGQVEWNEPRIRDQIDRLIRESPESD